MVVGGSGSSYSSSHARSLLPCHCPGVDILLFRRPPDETPASGTASSDGLRRRPALGRHLRRVDINGGREEWFFLFLSRHTHGLCFFVIADIPGAWRSDGHCRQPYLLYDIFIEDINSVKFRATGDKTRLKIFNFN